MNTTTATCQKCSYQNSSFDNNCRNCGSPLTYTPPPIPNYGGMQQMSKPPGADKRLAAGICGILLGSLGVHKFILGYSTEGVITLLVSLVGGFVTCGISTLAMNIIGIVEGIIYLTKSDEEFSQTYILNKKGWF